MAFRSEIIRALDESISNEAGMAFQILAVILVRQKYPALAATEHHWDDGLDAYASPKHRL